MAKTVESTDPITEKNPFMAQAQAREVDPCARLGGHASPRLAQRRDREQEQRRRDQRGDGQEDQHDLLVPHSQAIAGATPAGPCRSFPSQDAWTERPYAEGGVLVGDAAGYNDPILGQGLSVTLRDVRIVRDLLTSDAPSQAGWKPQLFEPYAQERSERLRRLRFVAAFMARLYARFDPESLAARKRVLERQKSDPELLLPLLAAMVGPDPIPAEVFTPEFAARAFGP